MMFTMAVLQNRRHELFCQFIVEGYPAGSARRAAGYRDTPWTNANGRKLKGQPKIKERIAELEQL